MRYPLVHMKPDDQEEDRCENRASGDLCKYRKVEGSDYCSRHGANKDLERKANKVMYDFKVDRVRARTNLLAAEPQRYKLDEELAILRMTLEDTINTVTKDEDSLFRGSDTIKNLVLSIDKLVQSCVTQSRQLKLLLTLQDLFSVVQTMVDIIAEEVQDEAVIERIANRISESVFDEYGGRATSLTNSQSPVQLDETVPTDRGSQEQEEHN